MRSTFWIVAALAFSLSGCALDEYLLEESSSSTTATTHTTKTVSSTKTTSRTGDLTAPDNAELIYSLKGEGTIEYQCKKSFLGHDWEIKGVNAHIVNHRGRTEVTQESDKKFVAQDGSSLKVTSKKNGAYAYNKVSDTLYHTYSHHKRGLLNGIRYVLRRDVRGGIAKSRCSKGHHGEKVEVPFTAVYEFYR